jgi:ParB family chromosome partitioning protein
VSQLDIPVKALYMLAAPSTPEPARQEALNRAEQGETITYTLAQEIVHEHKSHEPSQPEALQVPKEIPTPEETPQKPQIPHVAHNSGENEWYTPPEYIAAAHLVLGDIDLDPASSPVANEIVQAKRIFTRQENGLTQEWQGKIWMNPPYEVKLIDQFCDKLHTSVLEGRVSEAIVLVNNATETRWFHTLINIAAAVVFPTSRIKFHSPTGVMGAPLQGQAFIYIGARQDRFLTAFRSFGWGAVL